METSAKYKISEVLNLILKENNLHAAKEVLQKNCKTKPEKQARKLGQVIGALMDSKGFNYHPDLAVRFLNIFDK